MALIRVSCTFLKKGKHFPYFVSIRAYSYKTAAEVAKNISSFLKVSPSTPIIKMATPQQRSSIDCGIYVLFFTDTLIDRIVNSNIFNTEGELNGKLPNFEGYEILMKRAQLVMLLHRRQYTSYDINTLKKFLNLQKYKIKQNTLTKANKTVPSVVSSCECETNNNKMKPNNKLKVAYFF